MPPPNVNLYSLINIDDYRLKTSLVNIIYDYITQSTWSVTSIKVSNQFSINGDIPTNNYKAYVNGSVLIGYDCNIYGNISVEKDSNLNDVYVHGDMTNYGKLNLINANVSYLTASVVNVSKDITVLGNASIYEMTVINKTNLFGVTNISNANIENLVVTTDTKLFGANISGNTNVSKLYVASGSNLSGDTNISMAYINNMTTSGNVTINGANLINTTTITNANVGNLNVFETTGLYGANVSGILNASNISANDIVVHGLVARDTAIFNNGLQVNSTTSRINGGFIVNEVATKDLLVGTDDKKLYSSVFFGKIYADQIVCPIIDVTGDGLQPSAIGNSAISVYSAGNTYNPSIYYLLVGFNTVTQTYADIDNATPILFNCFAQGSFIYGLTNNGGSDSTFDLSANAGLSGITYNGPVNIGQATPNIFNVNATSIRFGVGNMTLDNDLLIGGNITSTSDKRLKENITPLSDCLTKIKKIGGYSFTRNDLEDKNKKYLGLLAQEVEEEFPDLVTEINNTKSINYQSFVAVLLECIKELNDKLENKILS
jgi:hypothetical protein